MQSRLLLIQELTRDQYLQRHRMAWRWHLRHDSTSCERRSDICIEHIEMWIYVFNTLSVWVEKIAPFEYTKLREGDRFYTTWNTCKTNESTCHTFFVTRDIVVRKSKMLWSPCKEWRSVTPTRMLLASFLIICFIYIWWWYIVTVWI